MKHLRKSDIAELKRTFAVFFGFITLTVVAYVFMAAFDLLPIGYVFPVRNVCLFVGAIIAFFSGSFLLGGMVRSSMLESLLKASRKTSPAIYAPLNEQQISRLFKQRIKEFSGPAIAQGFVPAGAYVAKQTPTGSFKTTCLIHPNGHSVIVIAQPGALLGLEILSYLDDGSVISSINLENAVTFVTKTLGIKREDADAYLKERPQLAGDLTFSDMAPYGYLVNRCPGASIEELIKAHGLLVKAVLADENIGLRKLDTENCRHYMRYGSRHFDDIKFKLGKLDNTHPYIFPAGELVAKDALESARTL